MKLQSFITISLAMGISVVATAQEKYQMYIGTYTTGKSEGIYQYEFDAASGKSVYKDVTKVDSNPSFLSIDPRGKHLFAVQEDGTGLVGAYARNAKTGTLKEINIASTEGADPCYVATDASGEIVVAGNYSSGNLSVHRWESGSLGKAVQIVTHKGSGPNKKRQESPHVHATDFTPDGNFLLVCDLGTDEIISYPFHPDKEQPLDTGKKFVYKAKPGSGPRHIVFHPNQKTVYALHELSGDITGFRYEYGKLDSFCTASMLPTGFTGNFTGAEIKTSGDGKFLYASIRGDLNEILVFGIEEDGKLNFVQRTSSGGKTPRFFEIDPSGNFLLAANQDSDNIIIFERNAATGKLTVTNERIEVGKPTCIVFVPMK